MLNPKDKKSAGKSSGKMPSAGLSSLLGGNTRKTGLDADWLEVDADVLRNLVWAVDFFGGAVTLSSTKSRAAYCIKVYMGVPFDPMYFDGDDEGRASLAAWVQALVEQAAMEG